MAESNDRYYRVLGTALQLIAFVRERPEAPEHVLVSTFVFSILSALADADELPAGSGHIEPSRS